MQRNSLKQQKINAELELIIDEFARAMRSANREHIGKFGGFTINLAGAWWKYQEFCVRNPIEKA